MKNLIFLISFGLICSCDRLGQKADHAKDVIAEKTKEEVSKLTDKAANKIFPPFDSDKPDTDNNKKRFTDFIKVDLSADIKNIFCFDDAIGIDADYMFSFNCDRTTARNIIEKHQLKLDKETTDYAFGLQHDFEWWDKKKIEKLDLYSWQGDHQYFKYFWYDNTEQKAYYFDFDR
jgi:hypothetical protein